MAGNWEKPELRAFSSRGIAKNRTERRNITFKAAVLKERINAVAGIRRFKVSALIEKEYTRARERRKKEVEIRDFFFPMPKYTLPDVWFKFYRYQKLRMLRNKNYRIRLLEIQNNVFDCACKCYQNLVGTNYLYI